MKKQECKVRPEIINVNSNEPLFYPFSLVLKQINVVAVVIILMTHM